jgi:transcriptional regulator with XRE-family HTH domain
LDEIREFAKAFKLRRLALGLTQTQVGQALSATKGPAYSQSAICRFEKLDITPKSAAKIKPVLEKWMQEAELKYADRLGLIHFLYYICCLSFAFEQCGRKSKLCSSGGEQVYLVLGKRGLVDENYLFCYSKVMLILI